MFSTVIIILFFLLNKKINLPIIILYLYHLSFLFISEAYVFRYGGDFIFYENYLSNNDNELTFFFGRNSLLFFLQYLGNYLSAFDLNLLFNFVGFIGIYFLYQICSNLGLSNLLIISICLIPSLNFFTSSISKDSFIFTAIMFIIYQTLFFNFSKNFFSLIFAFSCLLFIRPYIFILILPIYIFSYLIIFTENKTT